MAINKLFAGNVGNPSNSKGSDVAESVNALIDSTAMSEKILNDSQSAITRSLGNKFVRRVFCGIDSLTEGTPNSYTQRLVGFGSAANEQGLFVSLVETNVSDRIGFTAVSAVGNRGVFPRNHSLDGKGLYGEALSGGRFRHLPLVTSGVSREWQNATVYYLQQPGGGTFDFRQYASDGTSSAGITVNTDGELLLQSAQISKSTTTSQAFTEVLNATGSVVIFAILYTTTSNDTFRINGGQGGASCQDWARVNYATLTRWMDLLNIDLYVYNGGTNDRFTASGSVLRTYIEPYLQAVAAAGTSILLVEPTQTFDYANYPTIKSSEYPPIYRSICDDNKWGFSSMVNELGDFSACSARFGMELDGIHPIPNAHFSYGNHLSEVYGLNRPNETPATFSVGGGGVFDRFKPDFSTWYVNDKLMAVSTETMIFTFASGATFTNSYVDLDIAARVDSGVEYFVENSMRIYFRRGSTSSIILCQILKNSEKAKYVGGGYAGLTLTLNATIVDGQVVVTALSNFATRIFAKVTDVKVLIGSSAGPAAILVSTI